MLNGFLPWIASLALALTAVAGLLWYSAPVDGKSFAFNAAADVAGAMAFTLVLSPLFFVIRRIADDASGRREQGFVGFPYGLYLKRLGHAEEMIRILDTSCNILNAMETPDPKLQSLRTDCIESLRNALRRGASVEILLINPLSEVAAQRARDLTGQRMSITRGIGNNLALLNAIRMDDALPNVRMNLRVKLYDTSPGVAYYRVDRDAMIAFYPPDIVSDEGQHLDFPLGSRYGGAINDYFSRVWDRGTDFIEFLYAEVDVPDHPEPLHRIAYLEVGEKLYLTTVRQTPADMEGLLNVRDEVTVRTFQRTVRGRFVQVLIGGNGEGPVPDLNRAFMERYGISYTFFVQLDSLDGDLGGSVGA